MKANRVQADFRFSKRSILRFLNGLSIGLGNPSRLTIAAGMILFGCQSSVNAQLTILHSFGDRTVANDGAHPRAGLVQAPNGNFFGSTLNQATAPSTFVGTIFKMSRVGVLQIIQSFDPTSGLYTTDRKSVV